MSSHDTVRLEFPAGFSGWVEGTLKACQVAPPGALPPPAIVRDIEIEARIIFGASLFREGN